MLKSGVVTLKKCSIMRRGNMLCCHAAAMLFHRHSLLQKSVFTGPGHSLSKHNSEQTQQNAEYNTWAPHCTSHPGGQRMFLGCKFKPGSNWPSMTPLYTRVCNDVQRKRLPYCSTPIGQVLAAGCDAARCARLPRSVTAASARPWRKRWCRAGARPPRTPRAARAQTP